MKSVESYDHYENRWNFLPNMIEHRTNHSSVGIDNKLFVIGRNNKMSSEVFNSISRKLTMFNLELPYTYSYYKINTVSFNSKIVVFCVCSSNNPSKLYVYNVDEPNLIKIEITIKFK